MGTDGLNSWNTGQERNLGQDLQEWKYGLWCHPGTEKGQLFYSRAQQIKGETSLKFLSFGTRWILPALSIAISHYYTPLHF